MKIRRNAGGEALPRREELDLQPLARRDENEEIGEKDEKDEKYEKDEDRRGDQDGDQGERYGFLDFMKAAGFEEDEVLAAIAELDAYKSIPGTTLRRYVNRVQSSVETDCRPAFLKGVMVGTAISENLVVDRSDIDGRIDAEVKKRLQQILDDLDGV